MKRIVVESYESGHGMGGNVEVCIGFKRQQIACANCYWGEKSTSSKTFCGMTFQGWHTEVRTSDIVVCHIDVSVHVRDPETHCLRWEIKENDKYSDWYLIPEGIRWPDFLTIKEYKEFKKTLEPTEYPSLRKERFDRGQLMGVKLSQRAIKGA